MTSNSSSLVISQRGMDMPASPIRKLAPMRPKTGGGKIYKLNIGLREGEKLYEEVLNEMEDTKPTFHEKIRIAQVREYDYDGDSRDIDDLVDIAEKFDNMETVRKMKEIVPEYKINNSVYEVLDKEK